MPLISASIVLYKTHPDMFEKNLACVLRSSIDKVWIIDHSPSDILKCRLPEDSRIEYIHRENTGYGAGNNIAIRKSIRGGYDYHIVLNPDVYWEGDIVSGIARYMDKNSDVGQLMPKILYPDGSFQYQSKLIPTPFSLFSKRFLPGILNKRTVNKYELRNIADWDKPQNLPYLSGCFMFLRVEVLEKSGIFDERFFMYPEDIDLTRRIHRYSRTVYFPDVSVFHNYNRESVRNLKMLFIHIVNMCRYFNKWGWFSDNERKIINQKALNNLNI